MRLLKKRHKKPLANAPDDKLFWVWNGPALRNLRDLAGGLRSMSADQFHHHLNDQKNDFAKWISDVLGDSTCARELLRTKTQKTAWGVVERALNRYFH